MNRSRPLVDEREALASRRVVDEGLRRLAQDQILAMKVVDLAPTAAHLLARPGERDGKIITV